jgi:sigma-B regulation protein RsbU (phosphoserine phosphatase)
LSATGPPLGIDVNFSYEPQMLGNLEPGDFLLAGTDGLWESRNQAGEVWGIETVKNALLQVTNFSASEIGQFLLAELETFRDGHRQEDDISLIVVKFK